MWHLPVGVKYNLDLDKWQVCCTASPPMIKLYLIGKTCLLKLPPTGQWWRSEYLKLHLKVKVPVRILYWHSQISGSSSSLARVRSVIICLKQQKRRSTTQSEDNCVIGREICTGCSAKIWITLSRKTPKTSNHWWKETMWLLLYMEASYPRRSRELHLRRITPENISRE